MSDPTPAAVPASDPPSNLSKRRLIDSIAGLDSAFKEPASGKAAKKRKTSSTVQRTSTPALEALLARSSTSTSLTPSSPTASPPASYDPTSLPLLLARLRTFSRLSSFSPSKPASLSALQCALHGWQHTPSTRERVECVSCGRAVVLLPPSSAVGGWSSDAGRKLKDEYEKALFSREAGESLHKETCPWRMRPCARSLYRLQGGGLGVPAGPGAGAGGGGRRRLVEDVARVAGEMEACGLGEVALELPKEADKLVSGEEGRERLVLAVRAAAAAVAVADEAAEQPTEVSATTILLALFGWALPPSPSSSSTSSSSRPSTPTLARSTSASSLSSLTSLSPSNATPILSCAYCHRQVLASSYLPPSPSPPSSASSGAAPPARTFDLARQHHPFCPFVSSPSSSSAAGSATTLTPSSTAAAFAAPALKPGWQTRLEAVLGSSSTSSSASALALGGTASAGTAQQQREGLVEQGKTQDLLRYVRSLLGPKSQSKVKAKKTAVVGLPLQPQQQQ
ncbi:hypothetical protein JCM6882_000237 [Rhodosporidiobolus microsporus]